MTAVVLLTKLLVAEIAGTSERGSNRKPEGARARAEGQANFALGIVAVECILFS